MSPRLEPATPADAEAIAELRNGAADRLTEEFGKGYWSGQTTAKSVAGGMRHATVYVMRRRGRIVGTLKLQTKKPWAIDKSYFKDSQRPLYLTDMAVARDDQRSGIGRACLVEAERVAREWPADALRLDAYDAVAGAGPFYRKCGYTEVGRATFRGTPLIYYELLIKPSAGES